MGLNGEADIINNLFVGNNVTGTGGGAVYAFSEYPSDTYASIVNNTFVSNWTTGGNPDLGKGGAVLGRCYNQYSTTELTLVNNIFYNNRARDNLSGNSAARDLLANVTLRFCGAYSDIDGSESYHYLNITPDADSITHVVGTGDPPIFSAGYHLSSPGPVYTPLDQGHDLGSTPYDKVPLDDLDGLPRPAGDCTDMGCYETQ